MMVSWISRGTSTNSGSSWRSPPTRAATRPGSSPSASPPRSTRRADSCCSRRCPTPPVRSPASSHRAPSRCASAGATPSSWSPRPSPRPSRTSPRSPRRPPPLPASVAELDEGSTSRTTLRLPDHLKVRVEEAAARDGISVNAWLVRAVTGALEPASPRASPREIARRRALHRMGALSAALPERRIPSRPVGPASGTTEGDIMPVFATPEPISVTLDVAAANVRFIASDRDDTRRRGAAQPPVAIGRRQGGRAGRRSSSPTAGCACAPRRAGARGFRSPSRSTSRSNCRRAPTSGARSRTGTSGPRADSPRAP